ncbi:hypothetical protein CROQUDRAFT_108725 [Cronartium quercuum f. sp. fusiforme G11]|uniref:RNase H type-1 domain-containing protein n=1 Tax=Cronartium quercuum f. sp. fusiforme G11 TaxID=708437 RepID=A0A9P6NIA1_9BASI|nr:hypothetical protein CROQUDRAFT_108725 [Cronartium quercuum f. sp. fusiforme G11]
MDAMRLFIALNLLASPLQPSSLRKAHKDLPNDTTITLYWTPGYEGVEMNEEAEKAAKKAAEEDEERLNLPISLEGLLLHAKRLTKRRGADPVSPSQTSSAMIADASDKLGKGQASAIFQLQCGHNVLRKCLDRINAEPNERCESCNAIESPAHSLIYRRRYTKQRRDFRKSLRKNK